MKKVLCIFLAVITTLMLCVSAAAYDEEELAVLSELSDEELLAFLENAGVDIPTVYSTPEEYLPFARHIIEELENNPDAFFGFGYAFLTAFAESIKEAVLDYYGPHLISTYVEVTSPSNILTENTVIFPWDDSYAGYNCYAYAIGREEYTEPGWVAEGKTVDDNYVATVYETIFKFLNDVSDDLAETGYSSISFDTQYDASYVVTEHRRMICARFRQNEVVGDFHFMVKEENGYWYNKYSGSMPMRYHYTPSNDRPWVYEGYKKRSNDSNTFVYFVDEEMQYAGTIWYFTYTIPCTEASYVSCGNDTHIMACVDCGKTTGAAMPCRYKNGRCSICGGIQQNIMQSISPSSHDA